MPEDIYDSITVEKIQQMANKIAIDADYTAASWASPSFVTRVVPNVNDVMDEVPNNATASDVFVSLIKTMSDSHISKIMHLLDVKIAMIKAGTHLYLLSEEEIKSIRFEHPAEFI